MKKEFTKEERAAFNNLGAAVGVWLGLVINARVVSTPSPIQNQLTLTAESKEGIRKATEEVGKKLEDLGKVVG